MQEEDMGAEKNKQDLNLQHHYCENFKSHKQDFVTRR
jgi:hypothetical protein